jgi:hypothetical protein
MSGGDNFTVVFMKCLYTNIIIIITKFYTHLYEGESKIFRTDAVKFINLTTKRVWKLPTSTQLRATWHTDSLDMVVLPSSGAMCDHNCCIHVDGDTSPEYFGYTFVVRLQCNYLTVPYKLISYATSNRIKSSLMVLSLGRTLGRTLSCKQSLDVVTKRITVMEVRKSFCSHDRS